MEWGSGFHLRDGSSSQARPRWGVWGWRGARRAGGEGGEHGERPMRGGAGAASIADAGKGGDSDHRGDESATTRDRSGDRTVHRVGVDAYSPFLRSSRDWRLLLMGFFFEQFASVIPSLSTPLFQSEVD
jgi:hypothetical protein